MQRGYNGLWTGLEHGYMALVLVLLCMSASADILLQIGLHDGRTHLWTQLGSQHQNRHECHLAQHSQHHRVPQHKELVAQPQRSARACK